MNKRTCRNEAFPDVHNQYTLYTTASVYLIDIALNRDFRDSEMDWNSDGPALS